MDDDGVPDDSGTTPEKRRETTEQIAPAVEDDLLLLDESDTPTFARNDEEIRPHPGEIFDELALHASRCGLQVTKSDTMPTSYIKINFENGRNKRSLSVTTRFQAIALLRIKDLSAVKFVGDYSAICSYSEGWIEAAVRSANGLFGNLALSEALFGSPYRLGHKEPKELTATNDEGQIVRLGYVTQTGIFSRDTRTAMCLRLEGLSVATHDDSLRLLEDVADSVFMQFDLRYGLTFNLVKDRLASRRLVTRSKSSLQNLRFTFPRRLFERDAVKLYWSGRSSSATPVSQFLAFYQCVEYFFPRYSRQATIEKVKNLLKEPAFDDSQDKDLSRLVDLATDAQRNFDERSQLRATVVACVEEGSLKEFISQNESRQVFFQRDYKLVSREKIDLEKGLLESLSNRIYDIRCKIVHTKNIDRGNLAEMILPGSKEADGLGNDIEVLRFVAQRVLVVSSHSYNFFR